MIDKNDLTYPEIVCPDCDGVGQFSKMTKLYRNGWSDWDEFDCETCHGSGWIYDPEFDETEKEK